MTRALLFTLLLAGCGGGDPAPDSTPAPVEEAAATPTPAPPATPAPTPEVAADAPAEAWTAPVITALPDPATIPDSAKGLSNGDFAPELNLFDLAHGETYRLSDHVGPTATSPAKVTIVGFAASWCGRCKLSYPYLAQMQEEFGDDLHVVFVTTDSSEPLMKKEADLIKKGGLDVPVLRPDDHTLTAWLGRKRNIPHFYIVNAVGEVLVQDRGFGDKVKKVLPGQIRYALSHPDYVRRR